MQYSCYPTEPRFVGFVAGAVLEGIGDQEQYLITSDDSENEPLTAATVLFGVCIQPSWAESVSVSAPEWILAAIEFGFLYEQWQKSRKSIDSIVGDVTLNPFYFQIVGMGPAALPFIFARLRNEIKAGEPDHWFPALEAITRVDPVPKEDRGKINKMAAAWLEWWDKHRGQWSGKGLGEVLSQSR